MQQFLDILTGIPWYAWIAIVAILAGAVQGIVKMNHRHRERMAMIQKGMHPDSSRSSEN